MPERFLSCDLEVMPTDAIFGINAEYMEDPHPEKLNLSVGAYTDENEQVYVLRAVKKAKSMIEQDRADTHSYLQISGYPQLSQVVGKLVFGENASSSKFLTFQTLGGTGACHLAAMFLSKFCRRTTVLTAAKTWAPHNLIFSDAGFQCQNYRMDTREDGSLAVEHILEDLEKCPENSVVVLQGCCQNPCGLDPSQDGWRQIGQLMKRRSLVPVIDSAYIGFGAGLWEDSWSIRYFAELGVEFLVCLSFSKNLGLYGERIGCLMVFSNDGQRGIQSSVESIIRGTYSSPPRFGAKLILSVFGELYDEWASELREMMERIRRVREILFVSLQEKGLVWNQIKSTKGFFFMSPLSRDQIDRLKKEWHVYILQNGRVNMASLVESRVEYLAKAIKSVVG